MREVRCLCFNRCDIHTQSHMHRYFSASVSLPRFTLENVYLQVQKKHATVISSGMWALVTGNSFFSCANGMSSSIRKL